jgi:hypothetical protein
VAAPADMETREYMDRLRAGVGLRPKSVGAYTPTVKAVRSLGGCCGEVRDYRS